MIGFRGSTATEASGNCDLAPREPDQDNAAWIRQQLIELEPVVDKPIDENQQTYRGGFTYVVLLGGTSTYDFRLRVAQSHLRADISPSHWSHAALLVRPSKAITGRSMLLECSLEPWEGFQVPSRLNGLQAAPLGRYSDTLDYPNVALIRVPVASRLWRDDINGNKSVRKQFVDQRSVLDVSALLLEWLGFLWCAGNAGNPLLAGHGMPSAAVIESLVGAAGYDLSPGLDTTLSTPEAFWQTARWWQDYFADMRIPQMHTRYVLSRTAELGDDDLRGTPGPGAETREAARARGQLPPPLSFSSDSATARMFDRA